MTCRLAMTILAAAIAAPAAALAHPGNHDNVAPGEVAIHLASSVFHVSVLAMGICVLAIAINSALKRSELQGEGRSKASREA